MNERNANQLSAEQLAVRDAVLDIIRKKFPAQEAVVFSLIIFFSACGAADVPFDQAREFVFRFMKNQQECGTSFPDCTVVPAADSEQVPHLLQDYFSTPEGMQLGACGFGCIMADLVAIFAAKSFTPLDFLRTNMESIAKLPYESAKESAKSGSLARELEGFSVVQLSVFRTYVRAYLGDMIREKCPTRERQAARTDGFLGQLQEHEETLRSIAADGVIRPPPRKIGNTVFVTIEKPVKKKRSIKIDVFSRAEYNEDGEFKD